MNYDYSETIPYLLQWYDYNHRILPWRSNPQPYYVWISEIMLQQTRVEAVKGYFDRFITALPTIKDLAEVDDEKLMKLWEGLGYYNRARNLKKAAQVVVEEYGGELPADFDKLLALPGIGSYTAGAIGSIAFGLPVPAVDGNFLRVLKRVAGSFDDITKPKVKKQLEEDLLAIMPKDRPGDYNQSLMELGATVCIPNGKPLCDQCPLMHMCKAFHSGTEMQIPVKPPKKARKLEARTVFIYEYEGKYAIRKRADKGLLAGLWELPNVERKMEMEQVEEFLKEEGMNAEEIYKLESAKHIFSHIEWHMQAYYIKMASLSSALESEFVWATPELIHAEYSLPSAFEAYKKSLV
ncbi:MAG: A/G-specific adenine glycosylase [Lachnospiraceae bacterium]|nr:A/G-specific adenine glycosylase [Lachnospiraceae bacterium]